MVVYTADRRMSIIIMALTCHQHYGAVTIWYGYQPPSALERWLLLAVTAQCIIQQA